jgi:uncharacterized protein YjbI with pentapeptide repeats
MSFPIAVVVIVVAAFIALAYLRGWGWTGFTASPRHEETSVDRSTKTLWEWMQLLIIPLALAAVGFALNSAQSGREQRREDDRAKRERAIAAERVRDDTLSAYLQQMSELMLERELLRSSPGSEIQALARTLTLTALRRLDGRRKGIVLQFLAEARLIDRRHPRVFLSGADLRGTILGDRVVVSDALLKDTNLQDADFRKAILVGTQFEFADLRRADFRQASLWDPDNKPSSLRFADLRYADFRGVSARGTPFTGACLTRARFNDADLEMANFSGVRGYNVGFSHATLDRARFRGRSPVDAAALVDVRMDSASVNGTAFPKGSGSHGLALSRDDFRVSCPGIG